MLSKDFQKLIDIYGSVGSPSTGHLSSGNSELLTLASCCFIPIFLDIWLVFSGLSFSLSELLFILKDLAQMSFVTCLCPGETWSITVFPAYAMLHFNYLWADFYNLPNYKLQRAVTVLFVVQYQFWEHKWFVSLFWMSEWTFAYMNPKHCDKGVVDGATKIKRWPLSSNIIIMRRKQTC